MEEAGQVFPYMIVGYGTNCIPKGLMLDPLTAMKTTLAHELAEIVTNPNITDGYQIATYIYQPNAGANFDNKPIVIGSVTPEPKMVEIADYQVCPMLRYPGTARVARIVINGLDYWVPTLWSNNDGGCISEATSVTRFGNFSNHSRAINTFSNLTTNNVTAADSADYVFNETSNNDILLLGGYPDWVLPVACVICAVVGVAIGAVVTFLCLKFVCKKTSQDDDCV